MLFIDIKLNEHVDHKFLRFGITRQRGTVMRSVASVCLSVSGSKF